ncbi:hypothetical protein pb186bvf_018967 [Paramecium bursaria]
MNDIKEWNKQLRKRQFRKLFIHLEKFRNGNLHNQQQDIQILRRLCYCLNCIIQQSLLRNENFYKKTLITAQRKQRVYLQILYELMHAHYKKKYLKFFVYELNKFLQLQALRYKKEQQINQALYMNSYSQLYQNWKYTCNWTLVINAILLMEKQHFNQASQELQKVYDQIQGVIRKIILYKIEKHLTEMDLKKQINKHLVMLIHTMYLHFICLLYDDDFQGLQKLIKLFHYLVKDFQLNKEQIQYCKDLIKGQRSKLILYLQEQGEINRIIKILYPQDNQINKIQINPIDSYFYEKYRHESINKQMIKVPSLQPRISVGKKQRTFIYKKQQQSQSPRAQTQVTAQSEIKQESFSKQIQEKLQKDSFFSYLDVAKDAETCISQETERTMRAKTLYQPQRKISIDQTTKHALFRTLETQAIYYIEVQKANFQLQSIKQSKDQLQKKMITERLLAQVKPMDSASKSTFITQSQEQFDFKDQRQIYTDVHEVLQIFNKNLKNLAEAYSTNIRPRIMSQQNNVLLKQSELANSITRLKFK